MTSSFYNRPGEAGAPPPQFDPTLDLPSVAQAAWGDLYRLAGPQVPSGALVGGGPLNADLNGMPRADKAGDGYDWGAGGPDLTADGDDIQQVLAPNATPLQIDAHTLLGDYGAGPEDALATDEPIPDSPVDSLGLVGEGAPPGSYEVAGDNAFLLNHQGLPNGPGPQGDDESPGVQSGASAKSPPISQGPAKPGDGGIMSSDYRQLAQILGMGEGNYESYNTGNVGGPGSRIGHSVVNAPPGTVTGMTINQILSASSRPGTDPDRRFAVGAYQIVPKTLEEAKSRLHLTGNEYLTPQLQDQIFANYLAPSAGGGVLGRFLNHGQGTVDQAQYAAAKEWASVAVPAGLPIKGRGVSDGTMSYYGGAANRGNQRETQALRAFLENVIQGRNGQK